MIFRDTSLQGHLESGTMQRNICNGGQRELTFWSYSWAMETNGIPSFFPLSASILPVLGPGRRTNKVTVGRAPALPGLQARTLPGGLGGWMTMGSNSTPDSHPMCGVWWGHLAQHIFLHFCKLVYFRQNIFLGFLNMAFFIQGMRGLYKVFFSYSIKRLDFWNPKVQSMAFRSKLRKGEKVWVRPIPTSDPLGFHGPGQEMRRVGGCCGPELSLRAASCCSHRPWSVRARAPWSFEGCWMCQEMF